MFGQNPKLSPEISDGSILKVVKIFYTIQGEGPFVGMPAVFIRLAGCNLACTFCDTSFDEYVEFPLTEIIEQVQVFPAKLIVITGGEPLRQTIEPLCEKLLAMGYKIQIETNGTLYQKLPEDVYIVCSLKNNGGKYYYPHQNLLPYIDTYKFIVSQSLEEYAALPMGLLDSIPHDKIYLQPMDQYDEGKNADNLQYTIDLCMQYGYKLSIQLHKILGME